MSLTASVSSRHYLSSQYLWMALRHAALCREREQEVAGTTSTDVTHSSHALTSVLSSVAFLEALVNEVYSDVADDRHESYRVAPLSAATRTIMREYWDATNDGFSGGILSKYSMALVSAGASPFDAGSEPYQSAQVLIRLRNALMHFKPTWHDDANDADKLAKQLAARMQPSGLLAADDGSPWVPIKVLGASCAEWAPQTARTLADVWTDRLGIPRTYEADLATWP